MLTRNIRIEEDLLDQPFNSSKKRLARTAMTGCGDFESPPTPQSDEGLPTQGTAGGVWDTGRNIHFGLREHAMAAAMTGMALHGGLLPFGATFFSFSDYMRPSIRLAALSKAHVIYVWTHDSIALGEGWPDASARRAVGGSARDAEHAGPAAERCDRNGGGVAHRAAAHGWTSWSRAHSAEAARAGSDGACLGIGSGAGRVHSR
jgi:hypothetical protein